MSQNQQQAPILKLHVVIGGRDYKQDLDLDAQTPTDLQGLNDALSGHPGKFAWWAMLETLARAQYEELESQLKRLDAELYNEHGSPTSGLTQRLGKAPTVDAIKSAVTLDPRRQAMEAKVSKAKLDLDQITVGRQTMLQRRDSLLAIGSNMRAEMEARMFQIRDRASTGYPSGSRAPGALSTTTPKPKK